MVLHLQLIALQSLWGRIWCIIGTMVTLWFAIYLPVVQMEKVFSLCNKLSWQLAWWINYTILPYAQNHIGNYKIFVDQGFPRSGDAALILVDPITWSKLKHLLLICVLIYYGHLLFMSLCIRQVTEDHEHFKHIFSPWPSVCLKERHSRAYSLEELNMWLTTPSASLPDFSWKLVAFAAGTGASEAW